MANYSNDTDNSFITGTSGNDSVYNDYGYWCTISTGAGNDTINNDNGNYSSINAGAGNDSVYNSGYWCTISTDAGNDTIDNSNGDNSSINAGAGNDYIYADDNDYVTVDAGAGADTINGSYYWSSINGGAGNDSITGSYSNNTIEGGKGHDTIRNGYSDGSITYIYNKGDGNDKIFGFTETDTLTISGGSYSTTKSGNNIIVTVGTGKISLMGAASLSTVNINDGSGGEESLFITGTSGKDSIYNTLSSATIDALGGNDTIDNYEGDNVSINAGDGNDSVYNSYSDWCTISTGAGNDTINNYNGDFSSINAGAGNDSIYGFDNDYVTVDAGAGADTINGSYNWSSINGGAGNDSITGDYYNSTIEGGKGHDTIRNGYSDGSITYIYNKGDGNDKIFGFNEGDTLSISGSSYSTTKSGNNIIVTVGTGKISLMGAASLSTVNINDGSGGEESLFITGTSGADYLYNSEAYATIDALGGNDTIKNYNGDYSSINAGAGNDSIYAYDNDGVTVDAGAGADTINGSYYWSSINGGAGNDSITGSYYSGSTIEGGKGNDTIRNEASSYTTYIYTAGDGNDKIFGFTESDTLSISGGSYSTTKSGNNIIVTVGTGKISLMGAASLSAVYIDGEEAPVETNSWTYKNGTATYGTSSNTLCTVKGVKSKDGLSISGNVVTVAKASVNAKKITLTGTGYTLALADDMTKRETKAAAWSYSSGTATYKGTYKTKGYLLASDAKSISYYSKATKASTLATVKGVKSKNGLSISGKVITVAKASVNAKKITLTSDDYTLALANNVTKSESKPAAWSYSSGTATYKSSYNTAGYLLASNAKSISYYSKATTASTLASIKGAASSSGLTVSGSKITLKKSALKNKVTVSGSYEFDFASGYSTATITGTAKADTITARGTNISINAGKGNDTIKLFGKATVTGGDGSDTFVYNKGNDVIADYAAADTISIASGTAATSTSGDDLILTVGTGKITVTGGKNSTVTYLDDGGQHIYQKASDTIEGIKITNSDKVVTLTDDYGEDTFKVADLSQYKNKIITINAAKVPRGLEITANANSNSITGTNDDDKIYGLGGADTIRGGKGSDYIEGGNGADEIYGGIGSDSLWGGAGDDTLTGGDGVDIFIYEGNDDGHDTITDYADIDRIMILSGEKPALAYTPQSNNMTFNIGNGSIVIENPQGQNIYFVKADGTYLHNEAVIRSAK